MYGIVVVRVYISIEFSVVIIVIIIIRIVVDVIDFYLLNLFVDGGFCFCRIVVKVFRCFFISI